MHHGYARGESSPGSQLCPYRLVARPVDFLFTYRCSTHRRGAKYYMTGVITMNIKKFLFNDDGKNKVDQIVPEPKEPDKPTQIVRCGQVVPNIVSEVPKVQVDPPKAPTPEKPMDDNGTYVLMEKFESMLGAALGKAASGTYGKLDKSVEAIRDTVTSDAMAWKSAWRMLVAQTDDLGSAMIASLRTELAQLGSILGDEKKKFEEATAKNQDELSRITESVKGIDAEIRSLSAKRIELISSASDVEARISNTVTCFNAAFDKVSNRVKDHIDMIGTYIPDVVKKGDTSQ